MTPYVFFSGLKTMLKSAVWTGTTNKIFGDNVYMVPGFPIYQLSRFQSPTAFILDNGAALFSAHPQLFEQLFAVVFFVSNVQSEYGEASLLSGCRTLSTSQGAGLLDIENEIIPQITKITAFSGTKIMITEKTKTKLEIVQDNFPLLSRAWMMSCFLAMT